MDGNVFNWWPIVLAKLTSFHYMNFSGPLVCHSRDIAEIKYSDFVFVAICLRLIPKLK